jgi:hypothetical protein
MQQIKSGRYDLRKTLSTGKRAFQPSHGASRVNAGLGTKEVGGTLIHNFNFPCAFGTSSSLVLKESVKLATDSLNTKGSELPIIVEGKETNPASSPVSSSESGATQLRRGL